MRLLANETRFILAVVSGELVVSNRKKADIVADLELAGYDKMPPKKKVRNLSPCCLIMLHIPASPTNGRAWGVLLSFFFRFPGYNLFIAIEPRGWHPRG